MGVVVNSSENGGISQLPEKDESSKGPRLFFLNMGDSQSSPIPSFNSYLLIPTTCQGLTILYAGAQAVWKTHGGPILEDLICAQGKCVCHVLINAIKRQ